MKPEVIIKCVYRPKIYSAEMVKVLEDMNRDVYHFSLDN